MSDLFELPKNVEVPDDENNLDVSLETQQKEASAELRQYEETMNSEFPVFVDDVTDDTINAMFGSNWDGCCSDLTSIVGTAAEELVRQMSVYSSFSDYINDTAKVGATTLKNQALKRSGLAQLNKASLYAQSNYNSLLTTFKNFKSFENPIDGARSVLTDVDNILANMEVGVNAIIQMTDIIEGAIDYISSDKMVDDINGVVNKIESMLSADGIESLLSDFPNVIINRFLNSDFARDVLTMPLQLYKKLIAVVSLLSSIRAPTNLRSVLNVLKILRASVAEMKDATDILNRGIRAVNTLKENIQKGNYIGAFMLLQGSCKFIEKTSCFAAQYPYNFSYHTEGGISMSFDNTPNATRIDVEHPSGTFVEIAPNGDVVTKVKNDMQIVTEKDFQVHNKGDLLMMVDEKADIEAKTVKLTAKQNMSVSAQVATVSADQLNILSDNTVLTSIDTLTLAGGVSTSISSKGPLFLSSDSSIIMDAPTIMVGSPLTTLLSLNGLTMSSVSKSNLVTSGTVTMIAGLITLN